MKASKAFIFSLLMLFFSAVTFAQTKTDWKEQKDYHAVMSKTFHPAEEGNLQPVKMRSAELVAKADAWRKSEIPADIADKKAVKKTLNKLYKDSKKMNRSVKNGATDSELVKQLTGLHDSFHTIVGLCSATEDDHDH